MQQQTLTIIIATTFISHTNFTNKSIYPRKQISSYTYLVLPPEGIGIGDWDHTCFVSVPSTYTYKLD